MLMPRMKGKHRAPCSPRRSPPIPLSSREPLSPSNARPLALPLGKPLGSLRKPLPTRDPSPYAPWRADLLAPAGPTTRCEALEAPCCWPRHAIPHPKALALHISPRSRPPPPTCFPCMPLPRGEARAPPPESPQDPFPSTASRGREPPLSYTHRLPLGLVCAHNRFSRKERFPTNGFWCDLAIAPRLTLHRHTLFTVRRLPWRRKRSEARKQT